jgi:acetolactate synthase-like protein
LFKYPLPQWCLNRLDSGAFGTLGVGGGFALGAKLVRPDFQVWLVWGDGSCAYSVAEFDTFKRHNIPVIAIVGNDACWKQIEREQVPMLGDDVGCPLEYSAYHDVAAGYGGVGLVISSQDDDVVATLKEAQDHESNGRAVLINVHIGSTTFREGSLSA